MPSAPADTPMLPPVPFSTKTPSATLTVRIWTVSSPCCAASGAASAPSAARRRLARSLLRLRPPRGIEERVRDWHARGDLGVLLEPARLAVHQERHFRREPRGPDGLVAVEADVARTRGVPPAGLEHADEHEPLLVHPELPCPQVSRLCAHDVHGPALPAVVVHGGEVEAEPLESPGGLLGGVEVDVETEHHQW